MFHVEHRQWANSGRGPSVGRGEIDGRPTVPAVLRWLADGDDSPVHDPRGRQANRGLRGAKSSAGHHVDRSMMDTVAKGFCVSTQGTNPGSETQADDRPLECVDPLRSTIDKQDLKVGACDGDDKPGDPCARTQVSHSAGGCRNDLDESEGVGDHVCWGNRSKRTNPLCLGEDTEKPRMGTKIRHGDDPSG